MKWSKWFKYTGLYFMILAFGHGFFKIIEVGDIWEVYFFSGNVVYYLASIWDKDS